jgi:hypothetical protein
MVAVGAERFTIPLCLFDCVVSMFAPCLTFDARTELAVKDTQGRQLLINALIGQLIAYRQGQVIGMDPSCSETTCAADTSILLFCKFPNHR